VILGFTGTDVGLTFVQYVNVRSDLHNLVQGLHVEEVHHGDCVGADATFDAICVEFWVKRKLHPGLDDNGEWKRRAWCQSDHVEQGLPYLDRNRVIVHRSDILWACPREVDEVKRSGTWHTVREARERGVPVRLYLPDGSIR
jgi:hypothetical protein